MFGYQPRLDVGSIAGGIVGARLSLSASAGRHAFVLLAIAISAGLVPPAWHCVFKTF